MSFEFLHLTLGGKILILAIGMSLIALFLPWITLISDGRISKHYSAFSVFTSYIGYFIGIVSLFALFFTLSHTRKERLRAKLPLHLSDGAIVFFIGILFLVLSLVIAGMNRVAMGVASMVEIGDGLILLGVSSIFFIAGGILREREDRAQSQMNRYLSRSHDFSEISQYSHILHGKGEIDEKEKKNMSLPF